MNIFNHPWLVTSFEKETEVVNEPSDNHFVVSDVGTDHESDSIFIQLKERYKEYNSWSGFRKLMSEEEKDLEQKLIQMLKEGKEIPAELHIKRYITEKTADELLKHVNSYLEPRGMTALQSELGSIKTYDEVQSQFHIEQGDSSKFEMISTLGIGLLVLAAGIGLLILLV